MRYAVILRKIYPPGPEGLVIGTGEPDQIWSTLEEAEERRDTLAANLREAEGILKAVVMAELGTPHPNHDIRVRDSIRAALDYLPAEWFEPRCKECKHKRGVRYEWMKPGEEYKECALKRLHLEEVKKTVKFCFVFEPAEVVEE